ncbi:hypothetical protein A1Q2_05774 [Trichosporon asahii var. asahii CBS 8904]|uniref:Uncharacterized protein n=1 Tax=Trichosporon asahii var. asahii (strain CBS 8904) TaxID=1220162 RepID=K1VGI6_TRIAC|nr:hypothetical protein A1Q2_05774 [Trichosporon asahii var. asahii CBS 8904]
MRLSFISGAVLALAGLVSASNVVELDSKNFDSPAQPGWSEEKLVVVTTGPVHNRSACSACSAAALLVAPGGSTLQLASPRCCRSLLSLVLLAALRALAALAATALASLVPR